MIWIISLFIVIGLLTLAQYRVLAGLLSVLALVGGTVFFIFEIMGERHSQTKISTDEVMLKETHLSERTRRSFNFSGRLYNNSDKYTVTGFKSLITIKDCQTLNETSEESDCVVIAQAKELIRLKVPPQQARDFSQNVYFYSDFSIKHNMQWSHEIEFVRGESSSN